ARAHRRVPAAPAGQAGDHRPGPDQPPLRPLAGRRAHQGELRSGVHPPPEPAGGPAHHAQDPPRRPLPPRRLVTGAGAPTGAPLRPFDSPALRPDSPPAPRPWPSVATFSATTTSH